MGRATAVLAALSICLVATASAVAAPPWSPPVDLSSAGGDADHVTVAMNGAGTALPIWTRSVGPDDVIQTAPRAPGGDFAAPIDLTALDGNAAVPRVTIDPLGNAVAVWLRLEGGNRIVQAATRPAGGAFGSAVDVSDSDEDAMDPRVALSPSGDVVVAWLQWDGGDTTVQASLWPAGGSFGPPVALSPSAPSADSPEVAIDAAGTAIVVWTRFDGADVLAEAAVRPAGGSFPPTPAPEALSDPGGDASCPQIAIDPAGEATVVWCRSDGANDVVQAATRPAGGSFEPAVDVSASDGMASAPDVGVDAAGTATAVWDAIDGSRLVVQAATRLAGGDFSRPVDLSADGDAIGAKIAVSPDGDAVVAWRGHDGADTIVEAATRPVGGSFGPPVDLSAPGGDAREPRVAIDDEGSALVVWERFDGAESFAQASYLDAAGPRLTGLSVPATGIAGEPVSVSAAALDVWSPPVSLAWSFGDGGGATGPSASHVYARPGTYTVGVTVTDAIGRATSATRSVVVSPVATPPSPPVPAPPPAPALWDLELTPAAFRAAARGPRAPVGSRRGGGASAPARSRIGFRLDRAATVRFTVERMTAGRRVGGRCVRATSRNRSASACTRWVAVRGGFTRAGGAGRNGVTFRGRPNGRKLPPGRYTLLATPTASGLTGDTARAPFRILRPAVAQSISPRR
jgi:PKD domain